MRGRSGSRLSALVVAAGLALVAAATAPAQFSTASSAGPLTVSTATLQTPTAATAVVWSCATHGSTTVLVGWDEDELPDLLSTVRVSVLRASASTGPWTTLATQQPQDGVLLDTVHATSGSVYYAIQLTEGGWQSALSPPASVVLSCRG